MKVSNKTNLAAGIVLLLLAAFFSIALLLQPLDFGQFGPGHENFLFILGSMLTQVYGFTSILIPLFLFAAAISCFATNWTARRSMRLLTAIVPFFTSFAAEKLIKFFLRGENFVPLKITITVIVAVMLIIIEFLLAGILADKISAPKIIKTSGEDDTEDFNYTESDEKSDETNAFDSTNGFSAAKTVSDDELYAKPITFADKKDVKLEGETAVFEENSANSATTEKMEDSSDSDETNLDYEKHVNPFKKWFASRAAKTEQDNENDGEESLALKTEPILSKNEEDDPFKGVFDEVNNSETKKDDIIPDDYSAEKHNHKSEDSLSEPEADVNVTSSDKTPEETQNAVTDNSNNSSNIDDDNSNPASIITQEEYAALTGFNDEPKNDELEWPDTEEIKAKAGNIDGDTSDFEEDPFAFGDIDFDSQKEPEKTQQESNTGIDTENNDEDRFSFEDETPAENSSFTPDENFSNENAEPETDSSDDTDRFSFEDETSSEDISLDSDENSSDLENDEISEEDILNFEKEIEEEGSFDIENADSKYKPNSDSETFTETEEINFPEEEIIDDENDFNRNEENKPLNQEPRRRNLSEELFDEEDEEEDEEFQIFGQMEDEKNDETTLESDFEESFNEYENIVNNEDDEQKSIENDLQNDFLDNNYFTPSDVVRTQKMEDEEKKSSLSSEIFDDMEADIRKEVKKEMLYKKYGAPQFEEEFDDENDSRDEFNSEPTDIDSENNNYNDEALSDSEENEISVPVVKKNSEGGEQVAVQRNVSHRAVPKRPYSVPTNLLQHYDDDQYWIIDEETKLNAQKLMNTLTDFGISAEVISIKKGPVVTMYELEPAPGVRLSKIVSLQDNIALSLAASSVRIVAPIPGRAAVGIEVPNKKRSIVSFREMIEQDLPEFKKMAVPVVLGKDILGKSQIIDIAKTPHLLIAGATGAGKSVCVNSIILSILYKRSPQQVKMILVDPKVVELKLYNDIPHLLTPVITEPKKALQALHWCLCEMERRYALLDQMGVRDISSYNNRVEERNICTEKLPYIVIIIDEFADLMATSGKELESNVARLAAMSRAVGIHLVLATQRPSVNVITGLIKANIPSRIAFMVASRTDSNIIIDSVGAEKLLGKGDMLYASAVDPYPVRIQGTFESDNDVENVVDYVKTLGEPDYIDDEMFIEEEEEDMTPSMFNEGSDPLYEQALDIVIQAGKASASYIQRRLKIGYNRAARLVEEMEERGIVGPANGSKPREVIHMPD